jgi:hypothetical protein
MAVTEPVNADVEFYLDCDPTDERTEMNINGTFYVGEQESIEDLDWKLCSGTNDGATIASGTMVLVKN